MCAGRNYVQRLSVKGFGKPACGRQVPIGLITEYNRYKKNLVGLPDISKYENVDFIF